LDVLLTGNYLTGGASLYQSVEYVPSAGAGLGAGGQRVFTFQALQAGTVSLQLKRWRQWEGDPSVTERSAKAMAANAGLRRHGGQR